MKLEISNTFLIWDGKTGSSTIPEGIKDALNKFNMGMFIDLLGAQQPVDWCGYCFCPYGWEEDDEFEPIANIKVYESEEFMEWVTGGDDQEEPYYTMIVIKP